MDIKGYIRQQPVVLKTMLSNREMFSSFNSDFLHGCRKLLLVGTGSSMNAILASVAQYQGLAPSISYISPMTLVSEIDQFDRETVAIILSQSGQSKDAVDAAQELIAVGAKVVVMTGDASSPIAQLDCQKIILPIVDETVGPKTKGYFASVLGLSLLAKALNDAWPQLEMNHVLDLLSSWSDKCDEWAQNLAPELSNADVLSVLGQGSQLGTAIEGSLKIAEMSGVPSFGEETEEMSHGRFHGLTKASHVFFIIDDLIQKEFALRLSRVLPRFEITPHVIDMSGETGEFSALSIKGPQLPDQDFLKPLFAVIPLQFLAVYVALACGIVPEKMRYPDMGKHLGLKIRVSV